MDFFKAIEQRLEKLVSTDTSLDSANERPLALYLKNELQTVCDKAVVFESRKNRANLYAQIDGFYPQKILIHTHLDTDRAMKGAPIKLVKRRDLYFGRGTLDCKGLIAVWIQAIKDLHREFGKPRLTISFAAVADEESGGRYGTEWLLTNTSCFESTTLAIGEGGGYPAPSRDKTYYTFQTGEIESPARGRETMTPERVIKEAIKKGFYNQNTFDYFVTDDNFKAKRSVSRNSFHEGVRDYIAGTQGTRLLEKHLDVFGDALKEFNGSYELLPVISPGYSDNRHLRGQGIDVIGFFPLHPDNYLGGIHGEHECISAESIKIFLRLL